ncbi:MAG: PPOX class F420-dependent oxidoreductase [Acidimicrobiales bacterium]|jgi:pyridoxamine 5'-phosphate oxidase family protein
MPQKSTEPQRLTAEDVAYLRSQRLGRLATVDPSGAPQNNPVGFVVDDDTGQVLIGGMAMGQTRKFHNVRGNPRVALVVDDLASVDPWLVRGVEVRGTAEALDDVEPPIRGMSREVIRITPQRIHRWGIGST